MNKKAQQDITRKLRMLNHAQESGNVPKTCRYFGIFRDAFYQWKKAYATLGEALTCPHKGYQK
jgi:hypothetical protein